MYVLWSSEKGKIMISFGEKRRLVVAPDHWPHVAYSESTGRWAV